MSKNMKYGLVAAVVVVVAIIGYQLIGVTGLGGPAETATPQPTATPPAGTSHVLSDGPPRITVIIPAPGWSGDAGGGILEKGPAGGDPPAGAGMITFSNGEPLYVYGDPCHWESTRPATAATTVDELVAALAAQLSRDASDPVDVTVGGYAGKSITLHVPSDIAYSAGEFTDCDQGNFGSFGSDTEPGPARYAQGPGQIDELWILDVSGVLTVIDTAYYAGTPIEVVDELRAIVESAVFEMP